MTDIDISFIIPAHNAEKTLRAAIESIEDLKLQSEVLIVENGSSDHTESVAEILQEDFSNVKLLHSATGVSAARNVGLNEASGKWIAFVDADDQMAPDSRKAIMDHMQKEQADFWIFSYYSGTEIRKVTNFPSDEICDCDTANIRMLDNPTKYMTVWAKLFKADIIRQNNLRFAENLKFAEDGDFAVRYSLKCKKIGFSPECIYLYKLNPFSVMRTNDQSKADEYIKSMQYTEKAVQQCSDQVKYAFLKYILMHMNVVMVREVFAKNNSLPNKQKMMIMEKIKGTPIFAEAIMKVKASDCRSLRMLPILLYKWHLDQIAAMVYRIRAEQNAWKEKNQR